MGFSGTGVPPVGATEHPTSYSELRRRDLIGRESEIFSALTVATHRNYHGTSLWHIQF